MNCLNYCIIYDFSLHPISIPYFSILLFPTVVAGWTPPLWFLVIAVLQHSPIVHPPPSPLPSPFSLHDEICMQTLGVALHIAVTLWTSQAAGCFTLITSQPRTLVCTNTHTRTHTRIHSHTHTLYCPAHHKHTHTHTHIPSLSHSADAHTCTYIYLYTHRSTHTHAQRHISAIGLLSS